MNQSRAFIEIRLLFELQLLPPLSSPMMSRSNGRLKPEVMMKVRAIYFVDNVR